MCKFAIPHKNNAFVAKTVNTPLTKNFMVIFAPTKGCQVLPPCCKDIHFSFGLDLKPCHDTYHGKATQLNNQQNISSKNFPFQSILISLAPLVNFRKTAAVHLLLPFCFVEQKTYKKAVAMPLPFSLAKKSSRGALSRPC